MSLRPDVGYFPFPYADTYVTREIVLVEENDDSTLIDVENEYHTIQVAGQPPIPEQVTKECRQRATWRLIGYHTTGSNGKVRINLTQFLNCEDVDYDDPSNYNFLGSLWLFLATAHS